MAEDDKRRRGSRAAVVLLNQLVSLKLPYSVRVVLNFLERKAAREHKETHTGYKVIIKVSSSKLVVQ